MNKEQRLEILESLANNKELTAGQRLTFMRLAAAVALGNNKEINSVFRELTIHQRLSDPAILSRLAAINIPPRRR